MTESESRSDLRFAVIGAGMAGILSAIKLDEAGFHDFAVYEKGHELGGTWRENTYPGVACDVPSHLYSYSFDLNPDWSQRFAGGDEIRGYFERCARDHGVEKYVRLGDPVTALEYVDGRWNLTTAAGETDRVDVVIAATGVLHHPRYPDIEGLDRFEGSLFHSARWDHDVTLDGARVGIIGTGSTAVQITGAIVDRVGHLDLFQRTAQWVLQQENPPYADEEQAAYRADPSTLVDSYQNLSALFSDGFSNAVVDAESPQIKMIAQMCLDNLENSVTDPELRERLRPTYQAACKRLVISPNFYEAIQHRNAELVTETIECVEPGGVRTVDGVLHELDVLVLATGFKVDAFMRPMTIVGPGGVSLDQVWADRPIAYLSVSVPGFPNLFMLNGPNGPVGNFSLIEVAEHQVAYILQLVERICTGEGRGIAATWQATERHEAERVEAAKSTVWVTGCQSWYLDDRGIPASWPWNMERFRDEMRAPKPDAYELTD
jgi:cation diffusion facilitator CzcD-associated flavoprotein CzcO